MDRASGETRYFGATQFEGTTARWAFPCLDEPGLKATFKVRLGRKEAFISLSNMPIVSTGSPVDGYLGYVWDEFDTTVVTPSYLMAFVVGQFDFVESSPVLPNGVKFRTYATPDAIADNQASYSSVIGPQILQVCIKL